MVKQVLRRQTSKKRLPSISFETVYRNLDVLSQDCFYGYCKKCDEQK